MSLSIGGSGGSGGSGIILRYTLDRDPSIATTTQAQRAQLLADYAAGIIALIRNSSNNSYWQYASLGNNIYSFQIFTGIIRGPKGDTGEPIRILPAGGAEGQALIINASGDPGWTDIPGNGDSGGGNGGGGEPSSPAEYRAFRFATAAPTEQEIEGEDVINATPIRKIIGSEAGGNFLIVAHTHPITDIHIMILSAAEDAGDIQTGALGNVYQLTTKTMIGKFSVSTLNIRLEIDALQDGDRIAVYVV